MIHTFKIMKGTFKKVSKEKSWLKNSFKHVKLKEIEELLKRLIKNISNGKDEI